MFPIIPTVQYQSVFCLEWLNLGTFVNKALINMYVKEANAPSMKNCIKLKGLNNFPFPIQLEYWKLSIESQRLMSMSSSSSAYTISTLHR